MCQWNVVIILTPEAAYATRLYQSLGKGRKSDVPWSLWKEKSHKLHNAEVYETLLLSRTIYDYAGWYHLTPVFTTSSQTVTLVMYRSHSSFHIAGNPSIVSQHPFWLTACMKQIYTCLCRWRLYRLVPGMVWQTPPWKLSQRSTRKGNLGKQERFALRKYITDTREGNAAPVTQHCC